VEGLEHTAHLTAVTAGKPYRPWFFVGFATNMSIAWIWEKIKKCPKDVEKYLRSNCAGAKI
jgi:hypothetical protein